MTDLQAARIGQQVANLFSLKADERGRYETSWGSKTVEGIGRIVERIQKESLIVDSVAKPAV